jgi:hypothetical protein
VSSSVTVIRVVVTLPPLAEPVVVTLPPLAEQRQLFYYPVAVLYVSRIGRFHFFDAFGRAKHKIFWIALSFGYGSRFLSTLRSEFRD